MIIEIDWSTDTCECKICGVSWAEGAVVKIDGKVVFDKPAIAHCYDDQHTEREDVYMAILEALGHTIVEVNK